MLLDQPGLIEALSHEMTPKFLATRSPDGVPNVVPCTSLMPSGDGEAQDRLIFGNFLLRKSVTNLDNDPRVGILVITTDLKGWVLQGNFVEWQRAGEYVDRLNNTDLLRYNAYTGIRNAGVIDLTSVTGAFRISKLRVLGDYLLARAARAAIRRESQVEGATSMPRVVRDRFTPMTAVRVLACLDEDGYPLVAPVLSLQPAGDRGLVCAQGTAAARLTQLSPGALVAANLLTLDVVSFQAKGRWLGTRQLLGSPVGGMSVESVFAGGPPIPGRQVA
ncbi:MAG: pyridoxamine 5'-phosphate oxidase family protein [Anaerolineae bacterium]|nr:pyridoxamine 5'-phosphate oxidase family protein [Anaerolineae bacterium]